jgi:hypothetical protein
MLDGSIIVSESRRFEGQNKRMTQSNLIFMTV